MLNFRKITLEDKPVLDRILKKSREVSCENTFVNLFVWQRAYGTEIALKDGHLFIRYNDSYRFPIGGDLEQGLKEIIDHCGKYPVFWSPISEDFSRLPKWFDRKYTASPTRDGFDYIYLQKDLSRLEGKRYHSKRNHISAFSKKYNWRYEKITQANVQEVIKCAEEWYSQNMERLDSYALYEKEGVMKVLNNMDMLSVTGGAIFIDERVVAFTLGTPINDTVFDIFAEKALPDFAEGYAVINKEFALRELDAFKYINREDDMGLEGLRRAKLSYRPAVILEKYIFTPKETP